MKTEDLIHIGEKLERLRLNKKLSQTEVCENIGINRKTLSQIENGSNFSLIIFLKLLEEYGKKQDLFNIISLPKNFDIKAYLQAEKLFEKKHKVK